MQWFRAVRYLAKIVLRARRMHIHITGPKNTEPIDAALVI